MPRRKIGLLKRVLMKNTIIITHEKHRINSEDFRGYALYFIEPPEGMDTDEILNDVLYEIELVAHYKDKEDTVLLGLFTGDNPTAACQVLASLLETIKNGGKFWNASEFSVI